MAFDDGSSRLDTRNLPWTVGNTSTTAAKSKAKSSGDDDEDDDDDGEDL
jgi:hypothetical protein